MIITIGNHKYRTKKCKQVSRDQMNTISHKVIWRPEIGLLVFPNWRDPVELNRLRLQCSSTTTIVETVATYRAKQVIRSLEDYIYNLTNILKSTKIRMAISIGIDYPGKQRLKNAKLSLKKLQPTIKDLIINGYNEQGYLWDDGYHKYSITNRHPLINPK